MLKIKVLSNFLDASVLIDKSIESRIDFCGSFHDFSLSTINKGNVLEIVYFPLSTKLTFEDMHYMTKLFLSDIHRIRICIFYGEPFHMFSYWTNFFKENCPLLFNAYTLLPYTDTKEGLANLIDSFLFLVRISMYYQLIQIDFYDLRYLFENSSFFFWFWEKDIIHKQKEDITKSMENQFIETCNMIGINKEIQRYQEIHPSELPTDTLLTELVFYSKNKLQFKQVEDLIYASFKPFRFDANAIWGTGVSKFEEQIEGIQMFMRLKEQWNSKN